MKREKESPIRKAEKGVEEVDDLLLCTVIDTLMVREKETKKKVSFASDVKLSAYRGRYDVYQ